VLKILAMVAYPDASDDRVMVTLLTEAEAAAATEKALPALSIATPKAVHYSSFWRISDIMSHHIASNHITLSCHVMSQNILYVCINMLWVCTSHHLVGVMCHITSQEGTYKVRYAPSGVHHSPVNLPGIDCLIAQSTPPLVERKYTPVSDTAKKYTLPPSIAVEMRRQDRRWNESRVGAVCTLQCQALRRNRSRQCGQYVGDSLG
jgi:hypothetical protein